MTIHEILEDIKSPRRKKVILDCDTHNEMDDQYAVAYVFGRQDRFELLAMTAEHYHSNTLSRREGMEECYEEFFRVMKVCHKEGIAPVYRGAPSSMCEDVYIRPVTSEASDAIVRLANTYDELVYIIATGPITNVAAALHTDPSIKDKICMIWLGGNSREWSDASECNIYGDFPAARYVFDSGLPIIQLPAWGTDGRGTCQLRATYEEFKEKLSGDSDACVFFRDTLPMEYKGKPWVDHILWDIAGPTVLTMPEAFKLDVIPAPSYTNDVKYDFSDVTRHEIAFMERLDARAILDDMLDVIGKM